MKKVFVAIIIAAALILSACSLVGPVGNPNELTGTWTYTMSGTTGTVAGAKEGTWYASVVTDQPIVDISSSNITGSTVTVTDSDVPDTTTVTTTVVIAADGSFIATQETLRTRAERAAITAVNTGANQVVGYPAYVAGTEKTTIVSNVTVIPQGTSLYKENVTQTQTAIGTGSLISAGFPATALVFTQSLSPATTTLKTANALSFNGVVPSYAIQTVIPAQKSATTAFTFVVDKAGTFTWTDETTITQAAATASATVPAVTAGTAKTTTVSSGTLYGNTASDTKVLVLDINKTVTTKIGTGALISDAFPASAASSTDSSSSASQEFTYFVVKGSTQTVLNLTVSVGFGMTQPYSFILKK
jgi:hypothetical protein